MSRADFAGLPTGTERTSLVQSAKLEYKFSIYKFSIFNQFRTLRVRLQGKNIVNNHNIK